MSKNTGKVEKAKKKKKKKRAAKQVIEENREKMETMTKALLEFETLDRDDVLKIMDGSWNFQEKRQIALELEKKSHKLPPPIPPAGIPFEGDVQPAI